MPKLLDPDEMPGWLASLWPSANRAPFIIAGVNDDDCSVLKWDDQLLVITTDYLNARPIAAQLGIGTPADIGRLVVGANLSDLCGSGAEPRALLVAAMMEDGATEEEFKNLMGGVREEAARWGLAVIGGDTKLGPGRPWGGDRLCAHDRQSFSEERRPPWSVTLVFWPAWIV